MMKLSLYPIDYILTQGSPTWPWSWSSHFLIMSLLPPEDTNFRPHTYENGGQTENSNTNCFISKSALLLSLLSQNFTVGIELWFHKPDTNRKRNLKYRFHYRSKHNTKYLGVNLVKNVQNLYGEDSTVAFGGKILNSELKTSHLIKRIGCAGPPRDSCNGGAFTLCQNTSTHYVASLEDRCELKGHIWPMKSSQKERSGCQPGCDTYRCFVRWYLHQRTQPVPDSRPSQAGVKERARWERSAMHLLLRRVFEVLSWGQDWD